MQDIFIDVSDIEDIEELLDQSSDEADDEEPITIREGRPDGMTCFLCGDFICYAQPNQYDGIFICVECEIKLDNV